ncbi:hypothetical protein R6Z07F_017123 [Ovis aries]
MICYDLPPSVCIPLLPPSSLLFLARSLGTGSTGAPAVLGICPRGRQDAAEEAGRARAAPSRPGRRCRAAGAAGALMRPPPGGRTRSRGLSLGVLALCVAAARCLQSQGVSLYIPQPAINATVEEDILLSVDYSCHGIPTIEWKYTSSWGVQKIVEWKPGTQANISQSHKDRVCTFDNGSIQLFSVGVRDSGSYIITVTERLGSSQFGTIVLHVSEILYEDLHFVAVFLAFLVAVAALLISLMWVCNKCAYKFQRKRRHKLKAQVHDRHGSPQAASRSRRRTQTHQCPFPMQQPVEPDLPTEDGFLVLVSGTMRKQDETGQKGST